jgi:hypothetical protein
MNQALAIIEVENFLNYKDFNGFYHVKLLVFSGTPDPTFTISPTAFAKLEKVLTNSKYNFKENKRVMGYRGFVVTPMTNKNIQVTVRGNPHAEFMLLEMIKEKLSEHVYDHILETISTIYEISKGNKKDAYKYLSIRKDFLHSACENIPIRGLDSIPSFDPKTDDAGCFEEKQWENNCYNYGNDIVTNSFAQPGRGTAHKWETNTCEDVKRAAISDGLQWVGTEYPTAKPEHGHYLALLIWPGTNFHWVRLDSNGKWSHKPGGSPVTNQDNDGGEIKDPSSQDFSPWSQFCGYFNTLPTKVNIN